MQDSARPVFRVSVSAIVLFQVAALFARSMLDLSLQRSGMDPSVANDLSYLVVPPILLVLMFPYLRRCRHSLRELFAPHRLTLRVVACSVALGLTLRLIWWASTTFLLSLGIFRESNHPIVGLIIGFECPPTLILALSFLVMAGLIPLIEEVVYRGYIMHAILQRGTHVAIIMSALIFGFLHESPYVTAFLVGIFLALQAVNYRALWGPIITHATFNGAAVFDWDCFRIVWNPPVSDPVLAKLMWLALLACVGGTGLAMFLASEKAAGAKTLPRPPQRLD